MPLVGQGIPVQRTSSVLATKGSLKKNGSGSGIGESAAENGNAVDQFGNLSIGGIPG